MKTKHSKKSEKFNSFKEFADKVRPMFDFDYDRSLETLENKKKELKLTPYEQGQCDNEMDIEENPFPEGTEEHYEWERGANDYYNSDNRLIEKYED